MTVDTKDWRGRIAARLGEGWRIEPHAQTVSFVVRIADAKRALIGVNWWHPPSSGGGWRRVSGRGWPERMADAIAEWAGEVGRCAEPRAAWHNGQLYIDGAPVGIVEAATDGMWSVVHGFDRVTDLPDERTARAVLMAMAGVDDAR